MGQMTKCDEGHFYDKSQNRDCPFCGVSMDGLTKKYADGSADETVKYDDAKADDKTQMYKGDSAKASPGQRGQGQVDSEATIAMWSKGGGIDPVVGFLICHEGANQGRDYRIRSGYNTIGRDTSSQICIAGDDTIARIEHARIFYNLKDTSFHLIAGNGRSGAYVNEEVVLQSAVLKAYDVLEIGATKLTFLPFCGERFRWGMSKQNDGKQGTTRKPDKPTEKPGGGDTTIGETPVD